MESWQLCMALSLFAFGGGAIFGFGMRLVYRPGLKACLANLGSRMLGLAVIGAAIHYAQDAVGPMGVILLIGMGVTSSVICGPK